MSANVPEGSDWWEGWLWVRDTAGNITSMANFLFKQQRLFKLAKKKNTAHWGLNNSDVWWRQRNFACVFHKLESLSLTPLQNKSSQNTFFSFNLLVLPGDKKKDWQTQCHLKWRRISLLQPQLNYPSDRQRFRDYTFLRPYLCLFTSGF